jgi:L-serine dehydratase
VTSIFDLFKIGIGPSSLHTTGPMRAARRFVQELATEELLSETDAVTVDVYRSLALMGTGCGTRSGDTPWPYGRSTG